MAWKITHDKDCCDGCGECVEICPNGVWELVGEKSDPVNADECVGCESCVEVCPNGCIIVEEV